MSHRRPRAAIAAGLTAALAVTAAATGAASLIAAEPAQGADSLAENEKLGAHDVELLAEARAKGERFVSLMIAAEPGETEHVADRMRSVKGASVGFAEDAVGYVRATVPLGRAEAAIREASAMAAVEAIDLGEEIPLPEPAPPSVGADAATVQTYEGPDASTPAANPYLPTAETGAVDFVDDHPQADGRGITIGVLDTGVDLSHPALQETTTGARKITDWVTATDPVIDGDRTWRPMEAERSGTSFTFEGREYTAPDGDHRVALFEEKVTQGGEQAGDVNRDGDTTDSWALLYDPEAGTVIVDVDDDADFTNDQVMRPYAERGDVGYFGTDDPDTAIAEAMPFTVEIRQDVPMDPLGGEWIGKTLDFVNIGIVSDSHGTHVAGITAANGLFGSEEMHGAAPGAQVVSSRACGFPSCSSTALTEGMIDLVTNRGVDVVNMSIGGLPPLNDGQSARELLYNRLIADYGVQLFISAGNDGPGTNTVGDPSTADSVVSVGAAISKETWAANYGSQVERPYALLPFSSTGPRDDGGPKPTLVAPGSAISSIPTWLPGSPVPEAGYDLPPGYAMFNGTSMSSPQAAGAAALLLSAAERRGIEVTPASLRTALVSSADPIEGVQAHEQGAGRFDTPGAWELLSRNDGDLATRDLTVVAPVDHVLDEALVTPGFGPGVYDRESAPAVGDSEEYELAITRTSGPDEAVPHRLRLVNNHEDTFSVVGDTSVRLPLNEPVTVTLEASPGSLGAHSAILTVDDPDTPGVDHQVLNTVVVAEELAEPSFAREYSGSVQRNDSTSYFVRVPEGARTLQVAMSGLEGQSQTRWIAIDPQGVPAEDTSSTYCYPHYNEEANPCPPDLRTYDDPLPGVWEIEVESRRTSPLLDNPYTVTATALGATFEPETAVIGEAAGGSAEAGFTVTNDFAPITDGRLTGGPLGSAVRERPTIADGEVTTTTVTVPEGATELRVSIGNVADPAADLDLYVYRGEGDEAEAVGSSTTSTAEEEVVLVDPEAGTYTVEVDAYSVPAGSTEYDYQDVYLSPELGTVPDADGAVTLDTGESTEVTTVVEIATDTVPEGRELYGDLRLTNAEGSVVGRAAVVVESIAP